MSESSRKLVKEVQKISYGILCDVDKFCTDNNITYYLSGGTCLGAVRHHGFIPWDDDMDIMLPRPDYERFLKDFKSANEGKYGVGSLETDPSWSRPSARIWDLNTELVQTKLEEIKMGIFIDVFPIDGMPEHNCSQRIFFDRIKVLSVFKNASNRKDFFDYEKYRTLKKMLNVVTKPFGARFFSMKLEKMAKHYPFETSDYVGVSMALHYGMREKIKKKYMASGIRISFESGEFPVPVGYDQYLTNLYGDYMKIPKDAEEKGYTHLEGWEVRIKEG